MGCTGCCFGSGSGGGCCGWLCFGSVGLGGVFMIGKVDARRVPANSASVSWKAAPDEASLLLNHRCLPRFGSGTLLAALLLTMLYWAAVFFVIALVAAVLGFSGVAA